MKKTVQKKNTKRKTDQPEIRFLFGFQTHYFIIAKTYQHGGECEEQREKMQNYYIFVRFLLHYHNLILQQGKTPHIWR